MLPLAFGAAISPVILIVNVLLLSSTARPIARSVAYAVGCTIIIVGFGVAGVTVISGVSTAPRDIAAIIHLVVGMISLGFALRAVIQGPSPPPKEDITPEEERHKPAWRFVFAGLAAMGINMTTLTLYLSLDAEIVRAPISVLEEAFALTIADVIILIPVWVPLVLAIFLPRVAHGIFGPMNDFFTLHRWAIRSSSPAASGSTS
jgi:hypothetical protein